MNRTSLIFAAVAAIAISTPAAAMELNTLETMLKPWETYHCDSPEFEAAEAAGLDPYTHTWIDPSHPDLTVTVHLLCAVAALDEMGVLTDCTATGYSHTGWKWTTVENYRVDTWNPQGISGTTIVSIFQTSGDAWDNQVAANIYGSVSAGGSRANIAVYDGVNQFGWKDLSSTTIASTWTWKSSSSISALESDAGYNTDFSWSTSGASGSMDLQNIATHELGHTFGMGHSSSGTCLTMYPSGSNGETQKRTLGDGDINGIRARYP